MATVLNKSKKPHVLAVPFPAQGHVKPLMKLCHQIAKQGIKVTFVNIQSIHEKLLTARKTEENVDKHENIVLASIPDRGPDDDESDIFQQLESLRHSMPGFLTDLIERINGSDEEERISCVIADITIGWIKESVENIIGVEYVGFSPPGAAALALVGSVSKLIQDKTLDSTGSVIGGETITLSPDIPPWKSTELAWSATVDLKIQKMFFNATLALEKPLNQAKLVLGNTFYELEPAACALNPNLLPIGPLLETNIPNSVSSFHHEDSSCITWLDEKPPRSVIYVSFGSLAVFSQLQLDELALGLELLGHPFLLVIRTDLANGSSAVYPNGFLERVEKSGVGKIVNWAPQEKVLSHCSVACFVSHCGWNSTLEGLSNGVPFLCWPYFADQYHNQSYICDQWKIGLRVDADESGIRSRNEIKEKVGKLISDGVFKKNALKIKEMAFKSVSEGGSSYCNFMRFIDHLKNKDDLHVLSLK